MTTTQMTATDVLEQYVMDDDGKISFPVDTVALAHTLGADVFVANTDTAVSSFIVKEENEPKARIYLSSRNLENGNRTACAEEIAHLVPHLGNNDDKFGYVTPRNVLRGEMSDFAAELIMPGFAVRKYWAKGHSTRKIAKIFGVSELTMENRIYGLGLFGLH